MPAAAQRIGRWVAAIAVVTGLPNLAGCSRRSAEAPAATVTGEPAKTSIGDPSRLFLEASSQTTDGTTLKVDEVVLDQPGWVALHSHDHRAGAVGPVIGVSGLLAAGSSHDVVVTLYEPLRPAVATVYPMLHAEDTANTVFDYPDGDMQMSLPGTGVMVLPLRITVR